jgi:hypothetical protein
VKYVRYRIDPRVADILGPLHGTPPGDLVADQLGSLVQLAPPTPTGAELAAALRAPQWLLDRAADGGIPLTAAGYLKPADVRALAAVLPTMDDWIFGISIEVNARPVLGFREFVQRTRLLRKHKRALLLTKSGAAARAEPSALWRYLADHLIPAKPADEQATILALLYLTAGSAEDDGAEAIARALHLLGWSRADGESLSRWDVHSFINDAWDAIGNIGPSSGNPLDRVPSPAALALVRDALLTDTSLQSVD